MMFNVAGKIILTDPVFFNATPITKKFMYSAEFDLTLFPNIDYLVLTHNHYDHMNLKTLKVLEPKIRHIVTPLNNGHYIQKTLPNTPRIEMDWYEELTDGELTMTCLPSRHFSGRGCCDRFKAMWAGFALNDVYVSGDGAFNETIFK